MTKTFDQGQDEVAKLCDYFAVNHKSFLAPGVKEAHIRQSLINPFFEALGWDVNNAARIAPQYREEFAPQAALRCDAAFVEFDCPLWVICCYGMAANRTGLDLLHKIS